MKDQETRRVTLRHLSRYLPIFVGLAILTTAEVAVSYFTGGLLAPI